MKILMSHCRRSGSDGRCWDRSRRIELWCGTTSRIRATSNNERISTRSRAIARTRDARRDPPNQTAYLWRLCEMTSTSTPDDYEKCKRIVVEVEREGACLDSTTTENSTLVQSSVNQLLQITLQSLTEVLEHS